MATMAQTLLRSPAGDLERVLLLQGFGGTSFEYRRQHGHVVSRLAVQEHSSRTKCCMDLGVHFGLLAGSRGASAAPLEAMSRCEVRRRLTPDPAVEDFWWTYGGASASQGLVATLEVQGLPFLSRCESFPEYWPSISLEDLRAGTFSRQLPGTTRVRAALLLARLHAFLGNRTECRDLATLRVGNCSCGCQRGQGDPSRTSWHASPA
jgi:hypothetical protein